MNNTDNKNKRPAPFALNLRILIGIYFIYLSYKLFGEVGQINGVGQAVGYASIVIFIIAGIVITGTSLRTFIKGGYHRRGRGESRDEE